MKYRLFAYYLVLHLCAVLPLAAQTGLRPTLLWPNGGETIQAGAVKNVLYSAPGLSQLKIEYSQNGTTWDTISTNASAAMGYHTWVLPSGTLPATSYQVRISDALNPALYDTSAARFTIASDTLIRAGSTWKYKDNGSNLGSTWKDPSFNDSSWAGGSAEMGYGDGDETTLLNACGAVVSFPMCANKYITSYFRKKVYIPNLADFQNFLIQVVRDDGAIVYVNGAEVYRSNMPAGSITYTTPAGSDVLGSDEAAWHNATVSKNHFVSGWNTIAVELHQVNGMSDDVSFNFMLKGNQYPPRPAALLGPIATASVAAGTSLNLTWMPYTHVARVKIEYSVNGGSTWNLINSSVLNLTANLSWTVPNYPTQNGIIKISDTSNAQVFDTSAHFTINPPLHGTLIRGPYLQVVTPNSAILRWKTDIPAQSQVNWGQSMSNMNQLKRDSLFTLEHEVKITGLAPYTKYYYRIGSLNDTLQGDSSNYFRTLAIKGDGSNLYRIGVLGDCGTNNTNQLNVRNALDSYLGSNYMDSWILLGDNAYWAGTLMEYQAQFFNIYKDNFLKKSPLWPAPGNHDYSNNPFRQLDHDVPYYDLFTLPANAEAGGVASGTESFYSYDVGNIHFISLDSYGKENYTMLYDTSGAQVSWLKADLAANTNKQWVIAYWHHPPYTMGSHNSDVEYDLALIRNNFIRILERYGVDLVLNGHSHVYERSKLMKDHFGNEASFMSSVHHLSSSSALYDTSSNSCPYIKDSVAGHGTVYVVAGSSGQLGGSQAGYPHDAMYHSDATNGGALMLEVEGNRMDAKWVCADGVIRDHFTMFKGVNRKQVINVNPGDSVTLTASFAGAWTWSVAGAPNSRSIRVRPTGSTSWYHVSDAYSCLRDSFEVRIAPLPVRLVDFTATAGGDQVMLKWTTASEHNNSYFTIERSPDAEHFTGVQEVKSQGNSEKVRKYETIDPLPEALAAGSAIYYRLRQTDIDGQSSLSGTVRVVVEKQHEFEIKVYPNPNAGIFTVDLNIQQGQVISLSVTDETGKAYEVQQPTVVAGNQLISLQLPQGFYLLAASSSEGITVRQKIIVR